MAWITSLLAGLLLVVLPLWGGAASPAPVAAPVVAQPAPVAGIGQMLLGLVVVLGVIAVCVWLLRRLAPGQRGSGGTLKVVGSITLGVKERVVIVEVQERWLVLGVTPTQISRLYALPRPESTGDDPAAVGNFLQALLKHGNK